MGRTRGFKPQATQQNEKFAHLVNVKMVDCGVTRKKLMELTGRGSQAAQNATLMAAMDANTAQIIRRTGNDCPIPAYVVQPPAQVTFPTNCCGQFNGGGWGGNCGQCGNC